MLHELHGIVKLAEVAPAIKREAMTDNPGYTTDIHVNTVSINNDAVVADEQPNIDSSDHDKVNEGLHYSITDTPPWYLCALLGLQHYLTAFGSTLSIPMLLAPAFCLGPNDIGTAEILSTLIFVSGIITVLQTTLGIRLPILQGGTFSYLVPTFAILNLPRWQCPKLPDYSNTTLYNDTMRENLAAYQEDIWHSRVREIQGAIILASICQVAIGCSGILGIMLSYIGPLTICPTITLIGLALFGPAAQACEGQWWISLATIVCILIFSQLLHKIEIPCYKAQKTSTGGHKCVKCAAFPFFGVFPMLLSICLLWIICYALTLTDVLPSEQDKWGYEARTDKRIEVLKKAKWFLFPYPFQWGLPTFSVAGVFGMLAGVLAGIMESLGDYYACARLSGAPPPPIHAVNRGITIEGIGCILAGVWGTGNGTTSYSENIGAIGITKVGSRVVIQVAGIIMISLGMLGKFGALFVTIPQPVIGGVFMVTFGMITAVGISNLQYVSMKSSRNLFIIGISIFFGLSLPQWMSSHQHVINTGVPELDQILTVLLSTGMFVGGMTGFVLDNVIPGTEEERGVRAWRKTFNGEADGESQSALDCYDLPWCMGCISRSRLFKYCPICPTFSYSPSCSCRRRNEPKSNGEDVRRQSTGSRDGRSFVIVTNDIPGEAAQNRTTSF